MGDEGEPRVVKTYPLFGFGFRRSLAGHVLAIRATPEGRQGAPLLEHCRKPALCGRSCGAACQSACNWDPPSASKRDPLVRRFDRLALAPSELVGVAETARARVVG